MARYQNMTEKTVCFSVRFHRGVTEYDVPPLGFADGPELYAAAFKREGLTLVSGDVAPDAVLRNDGPTLEEWTQAGYRAEGYPPNGYAERPSVALQEYRKLQAESAPPAAPPVATTSAAAPLHLETPTVPPPAADPFAATHSAEAVPTGYLPEPVNQPSPVPSIRRPGKGSGR